MRYIISALFLVFFLAGCSVKEQVVEIKSPQNKEEINKKLPTVEKKDETVIETVEPNEIDEEVIPFLENNEQLKIAIIYSSKMVAKYVKPVISTTMGYLSYRNLNYTLKVIDIDDESVSSIQNAYDELSKLEINNIIALFTPLSINSLNRIDASSFRVYLPLIEKNDFQVLPTNYIYGSISYEDQINKLLEYSNGNYTMFYQESFLGHKLKSIFDNLNVDFRVQKEIKKNRNYYRGLVKDYKFNNSSLFMNTDIVKTSLLLSQITAYDIHPKVVLSTQINYDPELIELTQERDRDNFVVANSIDDVDDKLVDEIETFGGNIKYEWVDYSTLVGINYLYDRNNTNLIKTQIEDNKVLYIPRLFKSTEAGFLEIK